MTLPGGKKLVCIGSYRMTGRRLGRGNFAKVEEAVHTVLKTKVALKIMNISEIKEEYVVRNLHREARLMSRLTHPCIVTLFETMQNGSVYYLVTELIGGGDLCSFIKSQRGGKLEEKPTKAFGRQLVSAVAYMHSLGIVHRDLKMENIMLNETKTMVKIVDFGLSNMFSGDSMLRTHCGSPEYAAPELFVTGQMYGPQVDLWSLGVILYGMVMGHLPFVTSRDSRISSHDRRKHLLSQINRGLGPHHRKCLANFSVEFRSMINRLLLPDPLKRIPINELVRHPWLTDRNRRPLRMHGIKELEHSWKFMIHREVSKMLNLNLSHVEYTLRAEPFGFLAGIYNILAYRHVQEQEMNFKESLSMTPQRPATTSATVPNNNNNNSKTVTSLTHASCCEYDFLRNRGTLPIKKMKELRQTSNPQAQSMQPQTPLRVVGTRTVPKPYNTRSPAETKKVNNQRATSTKAAPPATAAEAVVIAKRRTKSEPLNHAHHAAATTAAAGTPTHTATTTQGTSTRNAATTTTTTTHQQPPASTVKRRSSGPVSSNHSLGPSPRRRGKRRQSVQVRHEASPATATPRRRTPRNKVAEGSCLRERPTSGGDTIKPPVKKARATTRTPRAVQVPAAVVQVAPHCRRGRSRRTRILDAAAAMAMATVAVEGPAANTRIRRLTAAC